MPLPDTLLFIADVLSIAIASLVSLPLMLPVTDKLPETIALPVYGKISTVNPEPSPSNDPLNDPLNDAAVTLSVTVNEPEWLKDAVVAKVSGFNLIIQLLLSAKYYFPVCECDHRRELDLL